MTEHVTFGVVGENWTDGRLRWRGKPALPMQHTYEEWSQVVIAREQTESVMIQYGAYTGAQPAELKRTNEILAKAFALVTDELLNDNLIPEVSQIVGVPTGQLIGYVVTIDAWPAPSLRLVDACSLGLRSLATSVFSALATTASGALSSDRAA